MLASAICSQEPWHGIRNACHIQLRNVRQEANNDIKKFEEATEDDKKGLTDDVQDLINRYNKIVDDLLKEKEHELLTV